MAAEREIVRADLVATAATKNAFDSWCLERTFTSTEEYAELRHELVDKVEFMLRHIEEFPEFNTEKNKASWKKRETETKIKLFSLTTEIGYLIFSDRYLPFVLRRWRESQVEK